MHPQMIYHADERAKEMELAAAERHRIGCSCSPFGRMISRVIMRCNGREGSLRTDERLDYAMAYPPAQTYYVRPTARTVTFTAANHHPASAHYHAIPAPEPPRTYATTPAAPFATAAAPPRGTGKPRKNKKKKRVRFTPGGPVPADAPPLHEAHTTPQHAAEEVNGAAAAADVNYHGAAEPYTPAPPSAHGQSHSYGYCRYAPSPPLPRWEMLGTPRRHEYFSGEYRWYYPTPVRERIYSIATDANRLTTIFSEENPNACTIV